MVNVKKKLRSVKRNQKYENHFQPLRGKRKCLKLVCMTVCFIIIEIE